MTTACMQAAVLNISGGDTQNRGQAPLQVAPLACRSPQWPGLLPDNHLAMLINQDPLTRPTSSFCSHNCQQMH